MLWYRIDAAMNISYVWLGSDDFHEKCCINYGKKYADLPVKTSPLYFSQTKLGILNPLLGMYM